ncbi:Ail/Lom family outer membrane beta-barrel protein [Salmonella enterica]|nr:hypothetical protein [Salmonella enterica]EKS0039543.1 Ail/Lom family outer membrane beta-barrel protein [Salmonella enterica]
MIKKITVVALVASVAGFAGSVNAAAGDVTVTFGYAQSSATGLKKDVNYYGGAVREGQGVASEIRGIAAAEGFTVPAEDIVSKAGKYSDPNGISAKVRYEITDEWGVIGALTYLSSSTSGRLYSQNAVGDKAETISGHGEINSKYYSIQAGPTYRVNDYVSGYVMAGLAKAEVDRYFNYEYQQPGKQKNGKPYPRKSGTLFRDNDSKTQLTYSAGLQFNVYNGLVLDVAYEGSGSGDWKTSGFNVGLGYKF